MEQNKLDLDGLRQQWSDLYYELTIPETSAQEISRMVNICRSKNRSRASMTAAIATIAIIGLPHLTTAKQDVFTNQQGLSQSQVVSIMDNAWDDINNNINT